MQFDTATPGVLNVQFSSSTPLAPGAARIIDLRVIVPATAPAGGKQLLGLANIVLNGGGLVAVDDDAVQVIARFGDLTGNQMHSAQDAAGIVRLASGFSSGLAIDPLLDPAHLFDLDGNGLLTEADAALSLQVAVARAVPSVPPLPGPTNSIVSEGIAANGNSARRRVGLHRSLQLQQLAADNPGQ